MLLGVACALGAALVYGVASILQAIGARQVEHTHRMDPFVLFALLRRPLYALALGLTLAGFVLHLIALRTLPLYLAQSAIAASLAVTAVLAVFTYGEPLARREWGAVGCVVGGLVLLTLAGGDVGESEASGALELGLLGTLAVLVVGGAAAWRVHSRGATAALGAFAGLGYAVVGVCGRVLPDIGLDLVTSPVAYVMAAAAGLAFLLYSIALQRGAVTTVTGPMIALQTAGPSLVGLLFLGDTVRSGWAVGAVAGFALTAFGTLVLVRFEGGPDAGTSDVSPAAAAPTPPAAP
ncbi:hypothetical protein ACIB24_07665 [Spongisporangium articulatum]|uniref:EamA domain-containing protein n=1 Tax=Spongisporangium articulatum TaxID=3362603 RepID=A0ABW8AMU0_9ACTN